MELFFSFCHSFILSFVLYLCHLVSSLQRFSCAKMSEVYCGQIFPPYLLSFVSLQGEYFGRNFENAREENDKNLSEEVQQILKVATSLR